MLWHVPRVLCPRTTRRQLRGDIRRLHGPELATVYGIRGIAWHRKGEYDKALADYNQALAINQNNAVTYNNRGNCWETKGEYDKAITDYSKALAINPKFVLAYNNRANAYQKKGDHYKAAADSIRAENINDDRYKVPDGPGPVR